MISMDVIFLGTFGDPFDFQKDEKRVLELWLCSNWRGWLVSRSNVPVIFLSRTWFWR